MSSSILQYCLFDPQTKSVLGNTILHGYNTKNNQPVYRYTFTNDYTQTYLMNRSQAQERWKRMQNEEYLITGGLEIEIAKIEIKKMEVSYLLLE